MFEVGQNYEFRMLEGGSEWAFWGKVEKYEHPLIKLADTEPLDIVIVRTGAESGETIRETRTQSVDSVPGKIINVASSNFISAVRKDG